MKSTKPLYLFIFALIIFGGYGLRVYDLTEQPPGLHVDEARNYLNSMRIADGNPIPWPLDDIPEPFNILIRGLYHRLAGPSIFSARLFSAWLGTLGIAAVIGATRAIFWCDRHRDLAAALAGITQAVLPAAVMLNRALYRVNWIGPLSMLALMLTVWALRTGKTRHFLLAGVCTALASMFYLSGLIMPVAIGAIVIVAVVMQPRLLSQWKNGLWMGAAFLITFSPWLYFYATVENWIGYRTNSTAANTPTLDNLGDTWRHATSWLELIYTPFNTYPAEGQFWAARHTVFSQPWLNPALFGLLLIGMAWSVIRSRRFGKLFPLVFLLLATLPAISTTEPKSTTRLLITFGPLAILSGAGVIAILTLLHGWRHGRIAIGSIIAIVGIYSFANTQYAIHYHYYHEPLLLTDPIGETGLDWNYNLRLQDAVFYMVSSDTPVYFPVNLLNHPAAAALLRSENVAIQGYQNEPLPEGVVFVPDYTFYLKYEAEQFQGFALFSPSQHTVMILPPPRLTPLLDVQTAVSIYGSRRYNKDGWPIGYSVQSTNPNMQGFLHFAPTPNADTVPLVVFDETLALLQVDLPEQIDAGQFVPVQFYWRVLHDTNTNYFLYPQLVQQEINRYGGQAGAFSGIYRWLYPTSLWQPDEIISEVRWIQVFADAPEGGYRLALDVHTHPNVQPVSIDTSYGQRRRGTVAIIDQTWIKSEKFEPLAVELSPLPLVFSRFSDKIQLEGVVLSPPLASLRPQDTFTVKLYWRARHDIAEDYTVFLHLLDENGQALTQIDTQLYETRFPTSTWYADARIVTEHALTIPDMETDNLALGVGIYFLPTLKRLTATLDNYPLPNDVYVITHARADVE